MEGVPFGIPVTKAQVKDAADDLHFDGEEPPTPSERDDALSSIPVYVEPHVLLSAVILVCVVGCDALTSIDLRPGSIDAPSSLRVTSLVLVTILASPALKGVNIVDQRVLIGLVLFISSVLGLHEASEETRTGDCVFITTVMLVVVYITNHGGIEPDHRRPDPQHDKPHRRQTVAALCGALFFYTGLRGIRATFISSNIAADYTIEIQSPSLDVTTGYAFSSTDTTVPLGFAYGIVTSIGVLICLHDDARVVGSSSVAYEVGAAGLAILVAATWALLGTSVQMEALMVLYGHGACKGDESVCFESARARRLVMSNNNSGAVWLAGLAALTFSFAFERSLLDEKSRSQSLWRRRGVGLSLATLIASIVAVFQYSHFEGGQLHTDLITLTSLIAIFISATTDTLFGSIMYAVVMTYEQLELLNIYGANFVFVHLTHVTLIFSLGLMWMWIGFVVLKDLLTYPADMKMDNASRVNWVIATVSTAGTSLTFGLFIASALLLAASNGNLPQEDVQGDIFRGGSPRRSMLAFFLDHFVPLLAWAPTYVCRCEILLISSWTRASAWLVAVPLDAFIYVGVLLSMGQAAPTAFLMQIAGVSVVGFAGIVAWYIAAFV